MPGSWPLGWGIFAASSGVQGLLDSTASHFLMAIAEVLVFACGAAIILKVHLKRIAKTAKSWMSGELALASYWQG